MYTNEKLGPTSREKRDQCNCNRTWDVILTRGENAQRDYCLLELCSHHFMHSSCASGHGHGDGGRVCAHDRHDGPAVQVLMPRYLVRRMTRP